MTETDNRMQRFADDIAAMKLKTGRQQVERRLTVASVVLACAGMALAVGSYLASLNVRATAGSNVDVLNSNSYEILALVGVGAAILGGLGFLRYSLAQFLRLWLLRQAYDQQTAIEQAAAPNAQSAAEASRSMP
jgi:hypothetical protein